MIMFLTHAFMVYMVLFRFFDVCCLFNQIYIMFLLNACFYGF